LKNIYSRFSKLYTFLLLVLSVTALQAQEQESAGPTWWVDPGIGSYATFGKGENRMMVTLGATVQKNDILYRLRYMYNYEVEFLNSRSPSEYYNSLNFLLGKCVSNTTHFQINILAGLGVTSGLKRDELIVAAAPPIHYTDKYTGDDFITPSVPLEVEFMFKPIKYVGLSAGFFFEINVKQPLFGFTGKVLLGKLK